MRRAIIVIILASLASMSGGGDARACTCAPSTPRAALQRADIAFSGLVTAVVANGAGIDGTRTATFEVERVYKGAVHQTTHIETPPTADACGIDFAPNRRYTVFAQEDAGRLTSQVCDATSTDAAYLEAIATPKPPTVLAAAPEEEPEGGGFPFLNVVAVFVGAVGITAWRRRIGQGRIGRGQGRRI